MNKEKELLSWEDFFQLFSGEDEGNRLYARITEDEELSVSGPSTLVRQSPELMAEINQKMMKVITLAIEMGMFLPSNVEALLGQFVEGEGGIN